MPLFKKTAFSFLQILFSFLISSNAYSLDIKIISPDDTSIVQGRVEITGIATLETGRVSISVDNGDFTPVTGSSSWSYSLNTITLADGIHQITAMARECKSCTPVTDEIQIKVQNTGAFLVTIESPTDNETITNTLVVKGQSIGAVKVVLTVDGNPGQSISGLEDWNAVFEPGAIPIGEHTIRATATAGDGKEVFDEVIIKILDFATGTQSFTYFSTVDNEPLTGKLFLPEGELLEGTPHPLVINLHGGGGLGNLPKDMQNELSRRGWIGIAPDGRHWGLFDRGCPWKTSAAYVDNPNDPDVGPGEKDILDSISWAQANFNIDPSRIYLMGFSMGGRGTYAIGLKNPDLFAAISPRSPAIDMFEIYERRPDPTTCKAGMMGGNPGDSPFVDTMYSITSGRFLIENAYNLPVFHAHGTEDTIASNIQDNAPFLHGWHIVNDTTWSNCHKETELCFGHTPTLLELNNRHPEGYDWAYMFTPVEHRADSRWLFGTPVTEGIFGTEDVNNQGNLVGMFDFFAKKSLNLSPDTVVYKTYTDTHRSAYWLQLDSATPWLNKPAAIRATRNLAENKATLELARLASIVINLHQSGLQLASDTPLALTVSKLDEPTFDPALANITTALTPTIILQGAFNSTANILVELNGAPVDSALLNISAKQISIGPVSITGTVLINISITNNPADSLASCATVDSGLNVDISCITTGTQQLYQANLNRIDHPQNSQSSLWQFDSAKPTISHDTRHCSKLDAQFNIELNCVRVGNTNHHIDLLNYKHPTDPDGWFWTLGEVTALP